MLAVNLTLFISEVYLSAATYYHPSAVFRFQDDFYWLYFPESKFVPAQISDGNQVVDCRPTSSSSSSIPQPRGSLGHHRWFRSQFPPSFPVLHCPLGLGEFQACPFPDVVFIPLSLSALSSFPFHCALQDGFGQTWSVGPQTLLNVPCSCDSFSGILALCALTVIYAKATTVKNARHLHDFPSFLATS